MKRTFTARAAVLVTAAMITASAGVLPAQAAGRASWVPTLLPLPAGHPDAKGFLNATDGKGEFTGSFILGPKTEVVSWRAGKPVVRGLPDGYEWSFVSDENTAGKVALDAADYDTNTIRSFILDQAGFHLLPKPDGSGDTEVNAINSRGDAVGQIFNADPAKDLNVVWPGSGAAPILFGKAHGTEIPVDIDEDGTVLLSTADGPFLWRDGGYRPVAAPAGYAYPYVAAIEHGVMVGRALRVSDSASQAFRWSPNGTAEPLPGGDYAAALNAAGLTVGTRPVTGSPVGKATVWRGNQPAGDLLQPAAFTRFGSQTVGADGTIVGEAGNGPLDEGGVPVIWRLGFPV